LAVAFNTDQATGDGSTASFNLSGTPLSGSLTVSVNGQIQEAGSAADYTLSGTTVSFAAASIPTSGARILFDYAVSTGSGTSNVAFTTDQAVGSGSQAAFTLTGTPVSGSIITVVNGQIQEAGVLADYTLSGNVVTFNSASIPAAGARISFHYGSSTSGSSGGQITMSQLPAGIPNGLATLGSDGKVPTSQLSAATGAQSFGTVGTTTWTVPAGVTRVYVETWGGGAGGQPSAYRGGHGGAGGGYAAGWCPVAPGANVTVTVGMGGVGGSADGTTVPVGNGGNSSFGTCLTATGAGWSSGNQLPGMDGAMPNGPYLWDEGPTSHSVIDTYAFASANLPYNNQYLATRIDQGGSARQGQTTIGAAGWPGCPALGGGGGGGTGARGDVGVNLAAAPGGISGKGGAGGNGGGSPSSSQPCTAGAVPGGGGGGGGWDGNAQSGCAGGNGLVRIWW
jgi:hypothetical protein